MMQVDWRHVVGMTVTGAVVAGVAGSFVGMGLVGLGAGALGGGLGGLLTARFFGRGGWRGWGVAMVFGLLATVVGAMVGGLPVYAISEGSFFGAFWEVGALALIVVFTNPVSVILWLAGMAALHVRARQTVSDA
ncbi:hypothetical protein AADZ90_010640 [Aestuariibius sp. 2305UL40-4]|uniref:hypothetical protein n=1 Tax=Aestuariibius violaceus TaxID=3234132 RepID=UPI003475BA62